MWRSNRTGLLVIFRWFSTHQSIFWYTVLKMKNFAKSCGQASVFLGNKKWISSASSFTVWNYWLSSFQIRHWQFSRWFKDENTIKLMFHGLKILQLQFLLNSINPKRPRAFGRCLFREMKFVFDEIFSNEDYSTLHKSWDNQLTFNTSVNAFRFKV